MSVSGLHVHLQHEDNFEIASVLLLQYSSDKSQSAKYTKAELDRIKEAHLALFFIVA